MAILYRLAEVLWVFCLVNIDELVERNQPQGETDYIQHPKNDQDSMDTLRVASVQFQHKQNAKAQNLQKIAHFVARAHANGARIVACPKMCITGYWHVRNLSRAEIVKLSERVPDGPSTRALLGLSRKYGITLGAGLIERDSDGRLYNTYVVTMSTGEVVSHRKLHCFISEHMSSGNAFTVFDSPEGWRLGILVCYDNNLIENTRITALMGAEILLAPHQTGGCASRSPQAMSRIDVDIWENRRKNPEALRQECFGPKGREWVMRWLPSRAHDNGLYVLFSNGVGRDDDEVRTGNAMVLGPYGEILAETDKVEDDIVLAECSRDHLQSSSGRRWLRARRPELYGRLTVPTGTETEIRTVRFG